MLKANEPLDAPLLGKSPIVVLANVVFRLPSPLNGTQLPLNKLPDVDELK